MMSSRVGAACGAAVPVAVDVFDRKACVGECLGELVATSEAQLRGRDDILAGRRETGSGSRTSRRRRGRPTSDHVSMSPTVRRTFHRSHRGTSGLRLSNASRPTSRNAASASAQLSSVTKNCATWPDMNARSASTASTCETSRQSTARDHQTGVGARRRSSWARDRCRSSESRAPRGHT